MNIIKLIEMAANKYDDSLATAYTDTNATLAKLVSEHGIEAVSAASGLKVSSIVQYTTKKSSPKVSQATVKKAESVLSQF